MLEGDSKRFHVWCVEGGEANDQKLIEQVDGLTGFDAIVEPEVWVSFDGEGRRSKKDN